MLETLQHATGTHWKRYPDRQAYTTTCRIPPQNSREMWQRRGLGKCRKTLKQHRRKIQIKHDRAVHCIRMYGHATWCWHVLVALKAQILNCLVYRLRNSIAHTYITVRFTMIWGCLQGQAANTLGGLRPPVPLFYCEALTGMPKIPSPTPGPVGLLPNYCEVPC